MCSEIASFSLAGECMRSLILMLLFFTQIAGAHLTCSQLFSSVSTPVSKYSTEKEIEKQMSALLSELSEKKLDYLTYGADKVSVYDQKAFKQSEKALKSALVVSSEPSGSGQSLSLFKGDAYFSHYYYSKYGAPYVTGRKMPLDQFSLTAPWFKWNEKTRTYSLETSGIVENIVSKVFGSKPTIKLYRGASMKEAEFMNGLSQMSDQDAVGVAQKKLKGGGFHGYFFTNEKSAAKNWSKDNTVVSVDIPREVVLQLAREGRIYAGVEGEYFEFMFFDPATIKGLANLYQIEK